MNSRMNWTQIVKAATSKNKRFAAQKEDNAVNWITHWINHDTDWINHICSVQSMERQIGGHLILLCQMTMANQQGIKADISLSGF
jgi:hypothetical protein